MSHQATSSHGQDGRRAGRLHHSSDGKVVYVTTKTKALFYAIDTATNKMLKKVPSPSARSIGSLPDGSRAFVSLENDGAIAVVDAQKHRFLHLIQLEGKGATPKPRPMGIAVHPTVDGLVTAAVRSCVPGRSVQEDRGHFDRGRSAPLGRRVAAGRQDRSSRPTDRRNDVSFIISRPRAVKRSPRERGRGEWRASRQSVSR